MRNPSNFRTLVLSALVLAAAVALVVLAAALPAWTQNAVPPTAREAAASPAFASRLARHVTPEAVGKSPAPAYSRSGRPSPQDQVLYENGPVNGTTDAWTINFGYVVSDTFTLTSEGPVTGFDFYTWEIPGDKLTSLQWSITSSPNGGTVYGSGAVSGSSLTDTYISTNQYGYYIDKISATGLSAGLNAGTYWFNLQNASVPSGDPVYWDENSGAGCNSPGCPSQAVESTLGTIPSESFDIAGTNGCFQPSGNLQILHSFTQKEAGGGYQGLSPVTANVYGATYSGGDYGAGLVYSILERQNNWLSTPLYSFTGGSDGGIPSAVTAGPDGTIYGTAGGGLGYGLVFSVRPPPVACLTALCGWTESVLYNFTGNNDASSPNGNLVFDQAGNLYGTADRGGAYGYGAVYELTLSNGGWTEKVIYSFAGSDGTYQNPNSLLVGIDGNLYGTTYVGQFSSGTVFQLVPSGGGWTENILHSFTGFSGDGAFPSDLFQDSAGNLYGTDVQNNYQDNVFALTPSDGAWLFSIVWQTPYGDGLSGLAGTNQYSGALGTVYYSGYRGTEPYYYFVSCAVREGCVTLFSGKGLFDGGLTAVGANGAFGITYHCGAYGYGTVWRY